jgi:hypothetical protein
MNCPHCGKPIETQQKRAAESRWSSMTKSERAAEMSRVRKLGVKRAKIKARPLRQNDRSERRGAAAADNQTNPGARTAAPRSLH